MRPENEIPVYAAPVPPVVGEDARAGWEVENVNGKQWRIVGPGGQWTMKPEGLISADEAKAICLAALAPSVAKPCGVKALEWREGDDTDNSTAIGTVNAQTPFGKYVCSNDGWFLWANGTQWIEAANRYAGRAAAQADFERRILSCLSHPAQGWREPEGCLSVGHQVTKTKGYPFPGEVRSVFKTRAGIVRYVIEATGAEYAGMLHIFSPDQIAAAAPSAPAGGSGNE